MCIRWSGGVEERGAFEKKRTDAINAVQGGDKGVGEPEFKAGDVPFRNEEQVTGGLGRVGGGGRRVPTGRLSLSQR